MISPWQAAAWRTAHPTAFWLICTASLATTLVWWPLGLAGLAGVLASLLAESGWRRTVRAAPPAG